MKITGIKKLEKLVHLTSDLNKIRDVDFLLQKILYESRMITNADAGSIYVKEGDSLHIRFSQNSTLAPNSKFNNITIFDYFSVPISNKSISGFVANHKRILNIKDMYNLSSKVMYTYSNRFDKLTGYHCKSSLTIPLVSDNDRVLGVLQLLNCKRGNKVISFPKSVEPYVEIVAGISSTALKQSILNKNLLLRMVRMSAMRDPKETALHVERVGRYSVLIYERWCEKNGVSTHTMLKNSEILKVAAMTHDIGKIGISDLILKKAGKFNREERDIMEMHCFLGYKLFSNSISEYDDISKDIALRHHENWDGSGYPGYIDLDSGEPLLDENGDELGGLKGVEIPFYARVVKIADVYDALSSERVYKGAIEHSKVFDMMKLSRGIQFDPELFDIFLELNEEVERLAIRLKD